ncbi:assimilatory sulfite reductase (NADPH) flavoprotein subunit [Thalassotalea fusca]
MLSDQQNLNQTMLDANQLAQLKDVTSKLTPLQLAWASGYLAAKSEAGNVLPVAAASAVQEASVLTVLYGSQTGNSKGVAKAVAEQAQALGLTVELKNMSEIKPKGFKNLTHVLIVASTNGEGEPPDDAIALHEFLGSKKAPKLDHLHYSVLALGDSSYEFFCQTGKDFDEYLSKLGAKQISPRVDCDVDYDGDAETWSKGVLALTKELLGEQQTASNVVPMPTAAAESVYSKTNPYAAELSVSQKITGRDSAKDVRHIEIDLGESGLTYRAGDALGVWFENDDELVAEILELIQVKPSEQIKVGDENLAIAQALRSQFEITQSTVNFVEFWANHTSDESLLALLNDKAKARDYTSNHQIVEIIKVAPKAIDAQSFVEALRKLTPRLYSIASSQAEVEEEVHLTVGVVSYERDDVERIGGASGFLSSRLEEGGTVKVFVEHNDNFRLPEDGNTPVIMIGPGTGVAPFRAFMQEREAQDAQGDNWLFFGDQTFTQDFLYQVEWQNYLKSGLLTRIDLAFSRDQKEKIYVQHRLKEQAQDVFAWLERGAHVYVCGDMSRMAKDVEQALTEIIAEQGQMSDEQAVDYLKELRNAKRYQKDVY